jgi:hypothetical protein
MAMKRFLPQKPGDGLAEDVLFGQSPEPGVVGVDAPIHAAGVHEAYEIVAHIGNIVVPANEEVFVVA